MGDVRYVSAAKQGLILGIVRLIVLLMICWIAYMGVFAGNNIEIINYVVFDLVS